MEKNKFIVVIALLLSFVLFNSSVILAAPTEDSTANIIENKDYDSLNTYFKEQGDTAIGTTEPNSDGITINIVNSSFVNNGYNITINGFIAPTINISGNSKMEASAGTFDLTRGVINILDGKNYIGGSDELTIRSDSVINFSENDPEKDQVENRGTLWTKADNMTINGSLNIYGGMNYLVVGNDGKVILTSTGSTNEIYIAENSYLILREYSNTEENGDITLSNTDTGFKLSDIDIGGEGGGYSLLNIEGTMKADTVTFKQNSVLYLYGLLDTVNLTAEDNAELYVFAGGTLKVSTAASISGGVSLGLYSDSDGNALLDVKTLTVSGSGSAINIIYGLNNYILLGKDIEDKITIEDGGVINILAGTSLTVVEHQEDETAIDSIDDYETLGTIVLDGTASKINLSGILNANIKGGTTTSGTLVFTNDNAHINGAVDNINIDIAANIFLEDNNIINGGVFSNIQTVSVLNGGSLNLGLNVLNAKSLVVAEGGLITTRIKNLTTFGRIALSGGTFDITSGAKLSMALDYGLSPLLGTDGKNFAIFSGPTLDQNLELLGENRLFDITETATKGTYTIKANGNKVVNVIRDIGGSKNDLVVASAWFGVSDNANHEDVAAIETANTLYTLIQYGTDEDIKKTFAALAPENPSAIQTNAIVGINSLMSIMDLRLFGNLEKAYQDEDVFFEYNPFEQRNFWVQGLYNTADVKDTKQIKGFKTNGGGIAMGVENRFNNRSIIGLSYAYNSSNIESYGKDTDVKTHYFTFYGKHYIYRNLFMNAIASYGISSYGEKTDIKEADYNGNVLVIQGNVGYRLEDVFYGISISPIVGIRSINLNLKDYTDTTSQNVSNDKMNNLIGLFELKIDKRIFQDVFLDVDAEIRLGLNHVIKNTIANSSVTLANGSQYSIEGDNIDQGGYKVGFGITGNLDDYLKLSINYDGKFGGDYTNHTIMLEVGVRY